MSDYVKKVRIEGVFDGRQAEKDAQKVVSNIENKPAELELNIDTNGLRENVDAIKKAIVELQNAFSQGFKFDGLEKSLSVIDKAFYKRKDGTANYLNTIIQNNNILEAANNLNNILSRVKNEAGEIIKPSEFDNLASSLKQISEYVQQIATGLDFTKLTSYEDVKEKISITTSELEKQIHVVDDLDKSLSKYQNILSDDKIISKAKEAIDLGSIEADKKNVFIAQKYKDAINNYIKLGGDLNSLSLGNGKTMFDFAMVLKNDGELDDASEKILNLQQNLSQLNVDLLSAERRRGSIEIGLSKESIEDLSSAIDKLNNSFDDADGNKKIFGIDPENLKEITDGITNLINAVREISEYLNTKATDTSNYQKINEDLTEAAEAADKADTALSDLSNTENLSQLSISIQELSTNINSITDNISRMSEAFGTVGDNDFKPLLENLKEINEAIERITSSISSNGIDLHLNSFGGNNDLNNKQNIQWQNYIENQYKKWSARYQDVVNLTNGHYLKGSEESSLLRSVGGKANAMGLTSLRPEDFAYHYSTQAISELTDVEEQTKRIIELFGILKKTTGELAEQQGFWDVSFWKEISKYIDTVPKSGASNIDARKREIYNAKRTSGKSSTQNDTSQNIFGNVQNVNIQQSASKTSAQLDSEGLSAANAAQNMELLARAKSEALKANEALSSSASKTSEELENEGNDANKAGSKIEDSLKPDEWIKDVSFTDEENSALRERIASSKELVDILGEELDIRKQIRKSSDGDQYESYRVTGKNGNTVTFGRSSQGDAYEYNPINSSVKREDSASVRKEAQKARDREQKEALRIAKQESAQKEREEKQRQRNENLKRKAALRQMKLGNKQSSINESEALSASDKQLEAYRRILEIKSKIADLNPDTEADEINSLQSELKSQQELFLINERILKQHSDIISKEEQRAKLAETRTSTEKTIADKKATERALVDASDWERNERDYLEKRKKYIQEGIEQENAIIKENQEAEKARDREYTRQWLKEEDEYKQSKKSEKKSTATPRVEKGSDEVAAAYTRLISYEKEYQELIAKREKSSITDKESARLAELESRREKDLEITRKSTELTEAAAKAQQRYNDIVEKNSIKSENKGVVGSIKDALNKDLEGFSFDKIWGEFFNNKSTLNKSDYTEEFKKQIESVRESLEKFKDIYSDIKDKNVNSLLTKLDGDKLDAFKSSLKEALEIIKQMDDPNVNIGNQNALDKLEKKLALMMSSSGTPEIAAQAEELFNNIQRGAYNSAEEIETLTKSVNKLEVELNKKGGRSLDVFDKFRGSLVAKAGVQLAEMYLSITDFVRYAKEAVQIVTKYDTALTEMRKVSDEPLSVLKDYQKESFGVADSIGSNALDLQNATASWMR